VNTTIDSSVVRFFHSGRVVAEYRLDDPFKPHFSSLKTPAGHEVTLVSPGDHRHHKGLMYALRCADLNFWEEGEGHGVQEVLHTTLLPEADGFEQRILWRALEGGLETYSEKRTVRARFDSLRDAIVLSWETRRESLRAHRLVKSGWSIQRPDGKSVNYHGLGIRLPWMWRFPVGDFCGFERDGTPCPPEEACGSTATTCQFWGVIDGHWNRTVASVAFHQPPAQGFAWFVLKGDFAYLSTGPTVLNEIDVPCGQVAEENYEIEISDLPASYPKK